MALTYSAKDLQEFLVMPDMLQPASTSSHRELLEVFCSRTPTLHHSRFPVWATQVLPPDAGQPAGKR